MKDTHTHSVMPGIRNALLGMAAGILANVLALAAVWYFRG